MTLLFVTSSASIVVSMTLLPKTRFPLSCFKRRGCHSTHAFCTNCIGLDPVHVCSSTWRPCFVKHRINIQVHTISPGFAVFDAGLSVHPSFPYLGASPDGKVLMIHLQIVNMVYLKLSALFQKGVKH